MGRRIVSVFVGLFVAGLMIQGIELISLKLYPFPSGLDKSDSVAVSAHIGTLPIGAFLLVLGAYVFGSFLGGFATARINTDPPGVPVVITGLALTAFGVITLIKIPHPTWFWGSLLIFIPVALIGGRLGTRATR